MLNRWLLYQTLSCRIWGRSGFYQSSGAYGFRDQLQDTLALLYAAPHLTRDNCCARPHDSSSKATRSIGGTSRRGVGFAHDSPTTGCGCRTRRCSTTRATGDVAVFDEQVPFLTGRILNPGEHEAYEQPETSDTVTSLYDHCVRAIAVSMQTGTHGLPLMGGGDWNDGMNMVGIEGKGESVWLAWFLISILGPFADLTETRGDADLARSYRAHAARLTEGAEGAWDGAWYRRAYFDDGTPLGSAQNAECKIDSIAQSWAVIAGTGDPGRARQAMESLDEHLVRRSDGQVLLLTPPFDHTVPSPGYIQGYVPGVRENGGQYTHAALWAVLAFAQLGDGDRAVELFAMLNPVNHARTAEEVNRYRSEPYVVAADIYSRAPHTGRGGWTWYTGSAGWMYRVGIEAILGLSLRPGSLHFDPCIPRAWASYELTLKAPGADYHIVVENPEHVSRGVRSIEVDGSPIRGDVPLANDGQVHEVRVVLGATPNSNS